MILAVLPLIPLAWAAGVAGWARGRAKKKKLQKEIYELKNYKNDIEKQFKTIAERQKQHEDDLNGVIVNLETGQTAEEVEFGIFPKKSVFKQANKITKDDDYEVNDRFEILDL